MNRTVLLKATAAGAAVQLAMVVLGHFVAAIRDHGFAIGGMLISVFAGVLYAGLARGALKSDLLGAAIAGGVCALVTIPISVALGDTPAAVIAFGTVMSTLAGVAGGGIARVLARPSPAK